MHIVLESHGIEVGTVADEDMKTVAIAVVVL